MEGRAPTSAATKERTIFGQMCPQQRSNGDSHEREREDINYHYDDTSGSYALYPRSNNGQRQICKVNQTHLQTSLARPTANALLLRPI